MLFLTIAIGIGMATYIIFATTNNPVIAAIFPVILSFAACPLMCAPIAGLMWLINRKKRVKAHKEIGSVEEMNPKPGEKDNLSVLEHSCCSLHDKSQPKEKNRSQQQGNKLE